MGASQLGPDCTMQGMTIETTTRRTAALVDVSVKLHSPKGGACYVRAEAVQITTAKAGAVSRLFTQVAVDGELQKPFATADQPGGDRVRPWSSQLEAGKTVTVTVRTLVEGDLVVGELDAPGRVRVDLRQLGPRVFDGAPVTLRAAVEGGGSTEVKLVTGDPKGTPATGSGTATAKLSKDAVFPFAEWKVTGTAPAATTAATATTGLGLVEYLRDGLARELAQGTLDAKDEKKVNAAWDAAFDTAFKASKSTDGVVAGMGARALAFLASGLSPQALKVRAEKEEGDAPVVPDAIVKQVAAGMKTFSDVTGQTVPPATTTSRSVRLVLVQLGEPGSKKKIAEEAVKRLAKRVEKDAPAAAGEVRMAWAKVTQEVPVTGKIVGWGMFGPEIVGEKPANIPGVASSKGPVRSRVGTIIRKITHGKGPAKFLFGAFALGAAGFLIWLAASRARATKDAPAAQA